MSEPNKVGKLRMASVAAKHVRRGDGQARKITTTDPSGQPVRHMSYDQFRKGLVKRAEVEFSVDGRPASAICAHCGAAIKVKPLGEIPKVCGACLCDCGKRTINRSTVNSALRNGRRAQCRICAGNHPQSLVGASFGKLTVVDVAAAGKTTSQRKYVCVCLCGSRKAIAHANLTSGRTTSCGCVQRAVNGSRCRKPLIIDGVRYESVGDARKILGWHPRRIRREGIFVTVAMDAYLAMPSGVPVSAEDLQAKIGRGALSTIKKAMVLLERAGAVAEAP